MGVENNNAIIATTRNSEEVARIKEWVEGLESMKDLFLFGSPQINNKTTVVMVPDGSKEGWTESDAGDNLRSLFIKEIEKANYENGSNPWDFIEVGYGEFGQKVLRGNCKNKYYDSEYAA